MNECVLLVNMRPMNLPLGGVEREVALVISQAKWVQLVTSQDLSLQLVKSSFWHNFTMLR